MNRVGSEQGSEGIRQLIKVNPQIHIFFEQTNR